PPSAFSFAYSSRHHRALPPFPTRRSSDLPENPFPNGPSMTSFPVPFFLSSAGYGMHLDTTFRSEVHFASEREDAFRVAVNRSARSEEHTSELQSRENLVCRLLLEKKNPRN